MGRNHLMMFGRGTTVSPKLLITFFCEILIKTGKFQNPALSQMKWFSDEIIQRYMMTYTNVYNYCTAANHRTDGSGRAMPRASKPQRNKQASSAGFIGAELYERLKNEIMKRVDEIHQQGSTKVCPILEALALTFVFSSTVDYFYFILKLGQIFNFLSKYWMEFVPIWIDIGSHVNVTNAVMTLKRKFMPFLIWELFNGKKYFMGNFASN